MRPFEWKELKALAELRSFEFDRHRGDHYIMRKSGAPRPVVIPMKKHLKEDIVLSVAKTIEMSRRELEDYIRNPKAFLSS